MGWASCGTDVNGRPIGYTHEAVCDHHQCETIIDRGLAYVCGGMHGEDEYSCEKYFCEKHMGFIFIECVTGLSGLNVCDECQGFWESEHVKECEPCAEVLSEQATYKD